MKTLGPVVTGIKKNLERSPGEVTGDRGFDQSRKKAGKLPQKVKCKEDRHSQEREDATSGQQRIMVPESLEATGQDRTGHRPSQVCHRMNRCRYKGAGGDAVNVVWATLAWNTKKVVYLHRQKEEK